MSHALMWESLVCRRTSSMWCFAVSINFQQYCCEAVLDNFVPGLTNRLSVLSRCLTFKSCVYVHHESRTQIGINRVGVHMFIHHKLTLLFFLRAFKLEKIESETTLLVLWKICKSIKLECAINFHCKIFYIQSNEPPSSIYHLHSKQKRLRNIGPTSFSSNFPPRFAVAYSFWYIFKNPSTSL